MISLDEALERLLQGVQPVAETDTLPTAQTLGRVLTRGVVAGIPVPSADNSAMDGYAVRVADAGQERAVLQRVPAGRWPEPLPENGVARIFTGASLPAGAEAVVMQEQCEARTDAEGRSWVRLPADIAAGQHVRRAGEDVRAGHEILPAGTRLNAAALGLAASVGLAALPLRRRVRVALFSTGDELVMPGEPLPPGAIYNSNRFTLRGLAEAAGCQVSDFGIVPDRLDAMRDALRRAAEQHDLIVTSGGVSVGEEDHLKPAAEAEGRIDHWQIAMKPGKPLAFGSIRRPDGSSALLVGLPGNPVSSFVTWLVAVSTVLRALQSMSTGLPQSLALRADFDWTRPDKRREFLRVRLNEAGGVELFSNQSSGVLTSAVWADGLVDNPGGQAIQRGGTVRFLPLASLVAR